MSQMLKSSGAMGLATLVSRLLGLVRVQVLAAFMGTSAVADAFYLAFTIPNLFRRLLGEGALTAAFIPIFKEKERREGEQEMWRSANAVVSGLLVAAAAVIGVTILGLTVVLNAAPLGQDTQLVLRLLRLMFPYMLLVCLAAVFIGILNSRGHFFIPALGAAMLNVVMIGSVLFLAPRFGETLETRIFGLGLGVLIAGVAQVAFQWPLLHREGYRLQWQQPWRDETVRTVVRRMVPASVGVAAFQINVVLVQVIAFATGSSILSSFNFAVRLMEFPQGIFGISLATFLLPTLSGLAVDGNYDEFRRTLRQGLGYLVFLNLLAAALLLALAWPVVRLLFERGEFTSLSTERVGWAVAGLAPGLVAFSAVNVVARAFFALGDTATPMRISVFCLAVNLVFSALWVGPFGAAGLAAANSLTSWLNFGLLLHGLRRKLNRLDLALLLRPAAASLVLAGLAGLVAWCLARAWEHHVGHASLSTQIGHVFAPALGACVFYWGAAVLLGVPAARDLWNLIRPGRR